VDPILKMIRDLLESLEHNPIFSGGLTLMLIGSAAAFLRKLPSQIWGYVERRLSITLEIPDRDPAFRWVQIWLASHPYARRARDLSLTICSMGRRGPAKRPWYSPWPASSSCRSPSSA
jgi:BCS1 N terminal